MTVKAKVLIAAFYGPHPKYSSWTGCSGGGPPALPAATGDIPAAAAALRKSGAAPADKKADRVAAEGRLGLAQDGGKAVLVEVNSETDLEFIGPNKPGCSEST